MQTKKTFKNPLKITFTPDNVTRVSEESDRTGPSYAKIINDRLSDSFNTISGERLISFLEMDGVFRMRDMNTGPNVDAIVELIKRRNLDRIIFSSKPSEMNGRYLVMVIEMADLTVIVDNSTNSLARTSRKYEIERLIQELHRNDLVKKSVICGQTEDTSSMTPEEAFNHIDEKATCPFNDTDFVVLMGKDRTYVKSLNFSPDESED